MKLLSNIIALIFISLAFSYTGFSQKGTGSKLDHTQVIFKEGGRYLYEGKEYKFNELEPIFYAYPDILSEYKETVIRRNLTRNSFVVFISSAAATSGFLIALNKNDVYYEINPFQVLGVLTYGTISIVSLPIFLINLARSANHNKRILKSFNEAEIQFKGYQKNTSNIEFGLTYNGVGLVYHF